MLIAAFHTATLLAPRSLSFLGSFLRFKLLERSQLIVFPRFLLIALLKMCEPIVYM